jgi:hypothetical protein
MAEAPTETTPTARSVHEIQVRPEPPSLRETSLLASAYTFGIRHKIGDGELLR